MVKGGVGATVAEVTGGRGRVVARMKHGVRNDNSC